MAGNLYKIVNNINNKVYIGKTYKTIQERWRNHLSDAYKIDAESMEYARNAKLQRAIRKYGPEHFKIELIGQFEEGVLEQKEVEYIAKYDSYHNGYNSTLGGEKIKN